MDLKTHDIKHIIDTLREIAKLNSGDDKLSQSQILELFLNLFGQNSWQQKGMMYPDSESSTSEVNQRAASNLDSDGCESVYREGFSRDNSSTSASILEERQASQQSNASASSQHSRGSDDMEVHDDHVFTHVANATNTSTHGIAFGQHNPSVATTALSVATSNGTVLVPLHEQLTRALNLLHRVYFRELFSLHNCFYRSIRFWRKLACFGPIRKLFLMCSRKKADMLSSLSLLLTNRSLWLASRNASMSTKVSGRVF